ncbi:hypothetical protein PL75_06745 [Neisseria arctica]|uniref:Uncharacterized protein n=1 Tax=Neisseria arctica TaxID=1470200 RepID=A0A0J1C387_9NEIS|nr:energy-coupling factor ABC transporter permease [Neisseria arctica]KLT72768.1 hypothetical protein PL75_06745 [Neisseria arctica]UOO87266.1 hypothetical protein LVJ86_03160 [Neisseria arctica]
MNFLASWFPHTILVGANILLLLILIKTAKPALSAVHKRLPAFAAAAVALSILWGLHVELGEGHLAGMTYHLLGISLVVLMLGAPAALWLGTLLLIPYTWLLHGVENLSVIGINTLALLLPSILLNLSVRRFSRRLPPHIFIYIFVNGFFTAAASMILTGIVLLLCLQFTGAYEPAVLWGNAFPVFFLLTWGEGFLSGIFTAIFVALAPQLLITYDDARYLQPKREIWKP